MARLLDTPPELAHVEASITGALARVATAIEAELHSDLPPVQTLCEHLEQYRGKMLRPTLVITTALACAGRDDHVPDAHVTVGAVCELVHLATLVHDDVLDEAESRRGGSTIRKLHGNEAAVILGDYLIASAYRLCSTLDTQATALLIGEVSKALCAGELLQLHHRDDYSIDVPTYFEILERKTASLIAAACRLGARHAGADQSQQDDMAAFGLDLGVAFQIQDDLLDLTGDPAVIGKPVGADLAKGKLTLPLIHHLASITAPERGRTLAMLEAGDAGQGEVADLLGQTGSIDHARRVARDLVTRAKTRLSCLPVTPATAYLHAMADAVVDRRV